MQIGFTLIAEVLSLKQLKSNVHQIKITLFQN